MTQAEALRELADRDYDALRDFPADGQLGGVDLDTLTDLLLAGFIERREVKRPCKTCGTPRFDYGYFEITGGGKLFMEAIARSQEETR